MRRRRPGLQEIEEEQIEEEEEVEEVAALAQVQELRAQKGEMLVVISANQLWWCRGFWIWCISNVYINCMDFNQGRVELIERLQRIPVVKGLSCSPVLEPCAAYIKFRPAAGSEDDQLTVLETIKAVLPLTWCARCVEPCAWLLPCVRPRFLTSYFKALAGFVLSSHDGELAWSELKPFFMRAKQVQHLVCAGLGNPIVAFFWMHFLHYNGSNSHKCVSCLHPCIQT